MLLAGADGMLSVTELPPLLTPTESNVALQIVCAIQHTAESASLPREITLSLKFVLEHVTPDPVFTRVIIGACPAPPGVPTRGDAENILPIKRLITT
jgi:hypothetical protein